MREPRGEAAQLREALGGLDGVTQSLLVRAVFHDDDAAAPGPVVGVEGRDVIGDRDLAVGGLQPCVAA